MVKNSSKFIKKENSSKTFVQKICPITRFKVASKHFCQSGPFCPHQSRFLEAPLVRRWTASLKIPPKRLEMEIKNKLFTPSRQLNLLNKVFIIKVVSEVVSEKYIF